MNYLHKIKCVQFLLILVLFSCITKKTIATVYTIDLALSGQKEVPANTSNATGVLIGTYNDVTNLLNFTLMFNGLTSPATAAHFHAAALPGSNSPVTIPFIGFPTGVTSGTYSNTYTLTATQESQLLCGLMYVNIHNATYPGGEIRSQVKEGVTSGNITAIDIAMVGQKENPANSSTATATLIGTFNNTTNALSFTIRFNGLASGATAAHFHAAALPGVNAPVTIPFAGFPTGVTSGFYSNTYTLTATQKAQFQAGLFYANIHNATYPGGEVRGQLREGTLTGICSNAVPTLSQWALLILCLLSLTIGMVYIYKKENAILVAMSSVQLNNLTESFNPTLYTKIFVVLLVMAGIVLSLCNKYFTQVSLTDAIGTFLSISIVAFIVQFISLQHRNDHS